MTHRIDPSKLQSEIDRNLKRAYDDVLNQDLPDRFLELIEQLRNSEKSGAEDGQDAAEPSERRQANG